MNKKCQILHIDSMSYKMNYFRKLYQFKGRMKRITKRRYNYFKNSMNSIISKHVNNNKVLFKKEDDDCLQPGDRVRIKSKNEIQETLNHWNQLKGCAYMEEMWEYCGTEQTVFKRVEKFLDERDYLMKKTNGIILLKDVFCEGTRDFGECDRSCFYFWREEWLERIHD